VANSVLIGAWGFNWDYESGTWKWPIGPLKGAPGG